MLSTKSAHCWLPDRGKPKTVVVICIHARSVMASITATAAPKVFEFLNRLNFDVECAPMSYDHDFVEMVRL